MSIYEKILEIMKAVNHIQKDDTVSYKSTNYKALSEEKVTAIMREKMIEQKLIVFPVKQDFRKDGYISHVDVTYRIVDTETGDYIEVTSCGDGADTQDKGAGKAMTYAYKYMWLRTFAIPTGEDPDKIASAQLDDMEKGETPEPPKKKSMSEPPKPKKYFPPAYQEDADYKGATNAAAKRLRLKRADIIELLNDEQREEFTFDDKMLNVQWYSVYCAVDKYDKTR